MQTRRHGLRTFFVAALGICPPLDQTAVNENVRLVPDYGDPSALVQLQMGLQAHVLQVKIDGKDASARGHVSPYLLTVPYSLGMGMKEVQVFLDDQTCQTTSFNVIGAPRKPDRPKVEDGLEVGFHRSFTGAQDALQLIIYGDLFDTNTDIIVDGEAIPTFAPSFSARGDDDVALQDLQVVCNNACDPSGGCLRRALMGLIPLEDSRAKASGKHSVRVRNRLTLEESATALNFTLPLRDLSVRWDWADGVIDRQHYEMRLPPGVLCRNGVLSTAGRTYSAAGYRLELLAGSKVDFNHVYPGADSGLGPGYMLWDLFDFFRKPSQGEWYVHGGLLTYLMKEPNVVERRVYGIRVNEKDAKGAAVFAALLQERDHELLFRTMLHELGHTLNLTHRDGDRAGLTVMNRDDCKSSDGWNFELSPASLDGLRRAAVVSTQPSSPVRTGAPTLADACCLHEQPLSVACLQLSGKLPAAAIKPSLKLTLSGPETVPRGAPVVLRAKLENMTDLATTVAGSLAPSDGFTSYTVLGPNDLTKERVFTPYFSFDVIAEEKILEKGGPPIESEATISCGAGEYMFAVKGEYEIVATFVGTKGSTAGQRVSSEPLRIHVTDAPDADASVLGSVNGCLFIEMGAPDTLLQVIPQLSAVSGRQASPLSPYASYALGRAYARRTSLAPGAENPLVAALSYLKKAEAAQAQLPPSFQVRLYSDLVRTTIALKHYAEATNYLKQLKAKASDDSLAMPFYILEERQLQDLFDETLVPISLGHVAEEVRQAGCALDSVRLAPEAATVRGPKEILATWSNRKVQLAADRFDNKLIQLDGGQPSIRIPLDRKIVGFPDLEVVTEEVGLVLPYRSVALTGQIRVDVGEGLPAGFELVTKYISKSLRISVPCVEKDVSVDRLRFKLARESKIKVATDGKRLTASLVLDPPSGWRIEEGEVFAEATARPKR